MCLSVPVNSYFYWEESHKFTRKKEKTHFYPLLLSVHNVRNQMDPESRSWTALLPPSSAEIEQQDAGPCRLQGRPAAAGHGENARGWPLSEPAPLLHEPPGL